MYKTNKSGAIGYARNLLGFPVFLIMQTYYSQNIVMLIDLSGLAILIDNI